MATKSLSALKSRKEEIIDHLEDLIGKEETIRIANSAIDPPMPTNHHMPPSGPQVAKQTEQQPLSYYSIWTSRAIATLPTSKGESYINSDVDQAEVTSCSKDDRVTEKLQEGYRNCAEELKEEEVIPFSDQPQICRFGPISRRTATMLQSVTPSQSQAVISDEPMPTAVVRHSKHMARQVPSMAALYHTNGSRTTLQPIAIGLNGEIGYIALPAVADQPQADPTLQQIQQNSALHQQLQSQSPQCSQQQQLLYAESERMRHELEQLQKKISDLNLARLADNSTAVTSGGNSATLTTQRPEFAKERDELAKELVYIESTIREREREISINHNRIARLSKGQQGKGSVKDS